LSKQRGEITDDAARRERVSVSTQGWKCDIIRIGLSQMPSIWRKIWSQLRCRSTARCRAGPRVRPSSKRLCAG